ncbi:MAG: S8 family serine peptidase [Saprospiraceae bacterium]|nr:S8 family serine peptidase [Saprospiraceae bacterium]
MMIQPARFARLLLPALLVMAQHLCAQMTPAERQILGATAERLKTAHQEKRQWLENYARQLNIPLVLEIGPNIHYLRNIVNGKPLYITDDNIVSAEIVSADQVKNGGALGLNLTGAGEVIGLWEAGNVPRLTHQEFEGRAISLEGAGVVADNHASHVAGTIMAGGIDDDALGFSENANLRCYESNGDAGEMAAEAALPNPICASNHSYGYTIGWGRDFTANVWRWWDNPWLFGAYDTDAQAYDQVAFDAPFFLIVKSAGNDRDQNDPAPGDPHRHGNNPTVETDTHPLDGLGGDFGTISSSGTAKNIVTVGAINDIPGSYTGPLDVNFDMAVFSSWGPTDDGRIKPDVVANGVSVYSAFSGSDTDYGSIQGTSMSTPAVTGSVGLLNEHWNNLFPGTDPRSSTMKGLLIHQADECGINNGPDYSFGWGLINVADAAELLTYHRFDGCTQLIEGEVEAGEEFTYTVESRGQDPLKVTLVWTDPPSPTVNGGFVDPAGANYLVNDLDLRINDGVSTHLPWVLDPANPANAATTGDNTRDNVEQVLLLTPATGTHTIRVVAPGTLTDGSQRFSLLLTGHDADEANKTIPAGVLTANQTYAARQTITVGPGVTIAPSADVRMLAGRSISLKANFHAQSGSRFLARIVPGGGCSQLADLKADNYPGMRGETAGMREDGQDAPSVQATVQPEFRVLPNPVGDVMQVEFSVETATSAGIYLFDHRGVLVKMLRPRSYLPAGFHVEKFQLENLAPGAYTCVLETPAYKVSKAVIVAH